MKLEISKDFLWNSSPLRLLYLQVLILKLDHILCFHCWAHRDQETGGTIIFCLSLIRLSGNLIPVAMEATVSNHFWPTLPPPLQKTSFLQRKLRSWTLCSSPAQDLPILPRLSKPYNKEEPWPVPQRWSTLDGNSTSFSRWDGNSQYFFLFWVVLYSMWDLSPLTRGWTHTPCSGSSES